MDTQVIFLWEANPYWYWIYIGQDDNYKDSSIYISDLIKP